MWSITALRAHPHFAPSFAQAHALCWPILWWQLNWLIRTFLASGKRPFLYAVNRWGLVTIHYVGDTPNPDAYKPVARTFRPLTDAGWGSVLPADIERLARGDVKRSALVLPREAGAGHVPRSELTDGTAAALLLDSS